VLRQHLPDGKLFDLCRGRLGAIPSPGIDRYRCWQCWRSRQFRRSRQRRRSSGPYLAEGRRAAGAEWGPSAISSSYPSRGNRHTSNPAVVVSRGIRMGVLDRYRRRCQCCARPQDGQDAQAAAAKMRNAAAPAANGWYLQREEVGEEGNDGTQCLKSFVGDAQTSHGVG